MRAANDASGYNVPMTKVTPWPLGRLISQLIERRLRVSRQEVLIFVVVASVFATARPTTPSLIVGGVIVLLGEILRIITAGYGYTVGEVSRRGPYRFVRHPYFLGTALVLLGLVLAGRHPWVMTYTTILLVLVLRADMVVDEARFRRVFGPWYDGYTVEVPALVPRLWGVSPESGDGRRFSLAWAVFKGRHRELDAVMALSVAFFFLYLMSGVTHPIYWHLGAMLTAFLVGMGRLIYVAFRRPVRVYGAALLTNGD